MLTIAIVAGVLAYPVIAGMVYRTRMNGLREPSEPTRTPCLGKAEESGYECKGANNNPDIWAPAFMCLPCERYSRAIGGFRRALRHAEHDRGSALTAAWLWPLLPLVLVPRRLFNAGANVTATRALPAEPATRETTEAPR